MVKGIGPEEENEVKWSFNAMRELWVAVTSYRLIVNCVKCRM